MEQNVNYIKIMIDSLQKKVIILDKIIAINEHQAEIIIDIKKNMAEYDATLDEKQLLIDELNILDEGFQTLYNRVQEEIVNNADAHKDDIREMQKYITLITEKTVEVQTKEEKNRQIISQQFSLFRQEVKQFKQNKQATSQYYNTMQNTGYITPQFLDKKK